MAVLAAALVEDGNKPRLGHPQRRENPLMSESVQRLAADRLDHAAQQNESQVAVIPARAGLALQGFGGDRLQVGLLAAQRLVIEPERGEAGGVGQALAQGQLFFIAPRELGEVSPQRGVQVQPLRVAQDHNRTGGGDHLGQRGQVKTRAQAHRRLKSRNQAGLAERLVKQHLPAALDQGHRAGDLPALHAGLDGTAQGLAQPGLREPG